MDLSGFHITKAPPSVYYVPDFITPSEEEFLISRIYRAPKPKWMQLSNRRLQNWGGIPHPNGMICEKIPDWLARYIDKVHDLKIFDGGKVKPNHVLVNEYLPGQGIMPHTDGPLFFPTIATISCGSHTVLEFTPSNRDSEVTGRNSEEKRVKILLEPRSLVVIKDEMYSDYLHGINERKEDVIDSSVIRLGEKSADEDPVTLSRETRLSFTIRNVPKTSSIKLEHLFKK